MNSRRIQCSLWLVAFLSFAMPRAQAQGFSISNFSLNPSGARQVQFTGDSNYYYILFSGATVTNIAQPTALAFGSNGPVQLQDLSPLSSAQFYRVEQVLLTQSLDVDADGISDVFELGYPGCLNPLDPSDASADCDGDGRSNLNEFNFGTDPTVADLAPKIVINEIDYDQVGTDTQEFVELLNKGASPVRLENYATVFVNGANNLEYLRVNLRGALAAGQYLVLASTNLTTIAPGAQVIYFVTGENMVQNGAPDGLTLVNLPTRTLMDALSYEGAINAALITGFPGTYDLVEGTVLPSSIADGNTVPGSLIRWPNGADTDNAADNWTFTSNPTPGAANLP